MNILFFASHWFVEKVVNSLLSKLLKLRNRHLFVCDILIFAVTPFLALSLRWMEAWRYNPSLRIWQLQPCCF
jgi:hypothetical protein